MKPLIIVALAATLAGCAIYPTAEQEASADYGFQPTQGQCRELAEQAVRSRLKDPYSAKISFGQCRKGYIWDDFPPHNNHEFGFVQVGTVNAKNGFGAYTGDVTFKVHIKNGVVTTTAIPPSTIRMIVIK